MLLVFSLFFQVARIVSGYSLLMRVKRYLAEKKTS